MSSKSGKAAAASDSKSRTKAVLLMLEKLLSGSNPDKEQTRFLCHKLLHLVNNHEAARKEISSKSGLETVLSILETCGDQPTCLTLVNILSEIASGSGVKRLVTHDVTRVLLHTVAYLGKEVDNRLLTALLNLSVKIAPKDRRFALRVRLAGALPVLVSIVRSSTSHVSNSKLLCSTLQCLKICASNGVNANVLGRLGTVHVLQKLISSLGRKHPSLIKTTLSTLSLLLKSSRSNVAQAIRNGMMTHMLTLHQEWHKNDVRSHKHIPARKSMLNIMKHLTATNAGKKAFAEAGGLRILHRTCKECVDLPCSKASEPLLNVGTLISRRCQPRFRLPIPTVQCSFKFQLPNNSADDLKLYGDTAVHVDDVIDASDDDDDDDDDEPASDSVDLMQDVGNDQLDEEKSQNEKEPSKIAPPPVIMPPLGAASPPKRRSSDLSSMYEQFFQELQEFQLPTASDEAAKGEGGGATAETKQGGTVLPGLIVNGLMPRAPTYSKEKSPRYSRLNGAGLGMRRHSCDPESLRHQALRTFSSSNLLGSQAGYLKPPSTAPNPSADQDTFLKFNSFLPLIIDKQEPCTKNCTHNNAMKKHRTLMQLLAVTTISQKQAVNTVSYADFFGHVPPSFSEPQVSKRYGVQRAKMLDDIGRTVKQGDLINKVVYTRDGGYQPPKSNGYWANDVEPITNTCNNSPAKQDGVPSSNMDTAECEDLTPRIQDACSFMRGDSIGDGESSTKLPDVSCGFSGEGMPMGEEGPDSLEKQKTPLNFRSEFECGNLRCAIQVRQHEYDLILDADCNTNHHHQWFYFEVSNVSAGIPYRFNIVNSEKSNSQFNFGMQPLMYSVLEARSGQPCWKRVGRNLCYYKSHFSRSAASAGGVKGRSYFTLSFTVTFVHDGDICYFSYHYPYTYTQLKADLHQLVSQVDHEEVYVNVQTLCHTLGGNAVPVLTVTARPNILPNQDNQETITEFRTRPYIFLSARVHPGESNSSWTMRGTLKHLLMSRSAEGTNHQVLDVVDQLRRSYIFKIVPMLNPDGVINGHHRCSLTGEDLNRQWTDPDPKLFPTIYHTKGLLQYLYSIGKAPLVYCDYHGHSRRKNVFMYGCSRRESILAGESDMIYGAPDDAGYKTLPKLLHQIAPVFSMSNCSFVVEKCKESTARVVVWKEMGVARSYTMESTYCGCDQGKYKGCQIGTSELEEMGGKLCDGLLHLKVKDRARCLPLHDLAFAEEDASYNSPSDLSSNEFLSADSDLRRGRSWEGKFSQSDSDYCGGCAPCPANSDEELTPDDVDSVSSFEALGGSNEGLPLPDDPLIAHYQREFWDYGEFCRGAGFGFEADKDCVLLDPETEMTLLAAGENGNVPHDPFSVAHEQLKRMRHHICPDTGRVEYAAAPVDKTSNKVEEQLAGLLHRNSLQESGPTSGAPADK